MTTLPTETTTPHVVPGVIERKDPLGNTEVMVPGVYSVTGANITLINNPALVTHQQKIVSDFLYQTQLYDYLGVNDHPFEWLDTPATAANKAFISTQLSDIRFEIYEEVQLKLLAENQREERLKKSAEIVRTNSEQVWQGVLNTAVQEALNYALQQINKSMPPELQVGVDVETGSGGQVVFKGLNVGDLSYDPETNAVTYGGDVFNAMANQGLEAVNKHLPSFAKINLNGKDLGLGSIVIDLDEVKNNPSDNYSLGAGVDVKSEDGMLVIYLGSSRYEIGRLDDILQNAATSAAQPYITSGLASLNKVLPSGMKVSVDTSKGITNPTLAIGPLSVEPSSGSLIFSKAAAEDLINSNVESYAFKNIPAPTQALARSVWKAIDLPGLLGLEQDGANPQESLTQKQTPEGQVVPATPRFTPLVPPTSVSPDSTLTDEMYPGVA